MTGDCPHGLRNEVAPWRESAPQPLSFTPREKAVVDQAFLLNVGVITFFRTEIPAKTIQVGIL